jgi:hypothetical protein
MAVISKMVVNTLPLSDIFSYNSIYENTTNRFKQAMTTASIATPRSTPTTRPVTTATGKPVPLHNKQNHQNGIRESCHVILSSQ